jgi:hypothetical protein
MNIIERGKQFVQSLRQLLQRTAWDWRRCPRCGSTLTVKNGSYTRHPWTFQGRQAMRVQRHNCEGCGRSYSEGSALVARGSWYAREVHRLAVDGWQYAGGSLRRVAEMVRSQLGRQERWQLWRPFDVPPRMEECCTLTASTVHRWLDQAGRVAHRSIPGQLEGIGATQTVGTDGLWARLRGETKRVVLLVVDSVSGLAFPPVVATGEEGAGPWQALFERAKSAGLDLDGLRGVTSDGAQGLSAFLREGLSWVQQQRCDWHLWRGLGRELKRIATEASRLLHAVVDASSYAQGEQALEVLKAHPWGAALAQILNAQLDGILAHLVDYYRGLQRVSPEWYWRDFRLRLSRGRNHRSDQRLERAALVWAICRNFTPAQRRSERKRHYRYPGQSPLEVAGAPPGNISYLDALGV